VAESYTLEAQTRTIVGKKVSQLRNQGLVPAVIYGAKVEPMNIQLPYRPLQLALMKAGGTHLIDIMVDSKTHTVLARAVQRHLIRGEIIHVDFIEVEADVKISTEVPLRLVGESPVVERRQGLLIYGTTTIQIETLPRHLISEIEVDISVLKHTGDAIHVRDLKVGSDITILSDADEMVIRVAPVAGAVAEEAEAVEFTSAEPERVTRRREEDEE
jgi:large subunit ribosomal protein L25